MAFGSFNKSQNEVMAEINVTPLVDVMLVLLIVFMITMPILTYSIPMELPTASVKEQVETKKVVRVSLNAEGIFLDGKLTSQDALNTEFLHYFTQDKDTVVSISADVAVEYRHIIKVLESAQQAGLKKIGFVTKPQ